MTFSTANMLPLVMQLGGYLKAAADHYANLKALGNAPDPDLLASFILLKLNDWHPASLKLDDKTKAAGARFLAGLVISAAS